MQKIPTLFIRDHSGRVIGVVAPGNEWVTEGIGTATRQWDGTACMVRDGKLFKRYTLKPAKTAPDGFEPTGEPAAGTGKQPGWVPVGKGEEDKWHRAAHEHYAASPGGTYELCGPHFQDNPEKLSGDMFFKHGLWTEADAPRDFTGLAAWFKDRDIEGIVFYHPDGRMVKIKGRDFGIKRPG